MGRRGNTSFQFKQFKVDQDQCGMKICTDACILGAWTPVEHINSILDIGTGTGLLSLMMAQRSGAQQIDALEIEDNAYHQATDNFNQSPWNNRLRLFHQPIQEYSQIQDTCYDLIITNPPFYPDHLRSEDLKRNTAHHNDQLPFEELASAIGKLLAKKGICSVLLPERQMEDFAAIARTQGLSPFKKLNIRDREGKQILRVVQLFSREQQTMETSELLIKNPDGSYSDPYAELMREFLLIF